MPGAVVQRLIAKWRRQGLRAPIAVAAFLAQRLGEVGPERARDVDRDGEARDDPPLCGLATKARSGDYPDEFESRKLRRRISPREAQGPP